MGLAGVTYRSMGGQGQTMCSTPANSEGLRASGEGQGILSSYLRQPLAAVYSDGKAEPRISSALPPEPSHKEMVMCS